MFELVVSQTLTPGVVGATLAGVLLGLAIGSMPGLNVTMAMALLIPVSVGLPTGPGVALLVAVFVAGLTGGAYSAILLNIPGTPSAAATLVDGHPMAKQGDGGRALGLAVISSAIGGLLSLVVLILVAPQLARVARQFGSPELFALVLLGVMIIAGFGTKSVIKGLIATIIGLLVMTVGLDPLTSEPRFTFGVVELQRGVSLIPAMIGLFAIPQVLTTVSSQIGWGGSGIATKLTRIFPSLADIRHVLPAVVRSGGIGTALGIIPGTNGAVAAFMSYEATRRLAKDKSRFGHGDPRGIASAEAGNNGLTGGAMVPLLTLGIPGDNITAVLLGALLLHGLAPGPLLFTENPEFVALIFGVLLLANLLTLAVSLVGIRGFVQILRVPAHVLMPIILVLSVIGAFAVQGSFFDVWVMIGFGVLGYLLVRHGFPVVPVLIGIVLGPALEGHLRRSLVIADGDVSVFVARPIALTLLIVAAAVVFGPGLWRLARQIFGLGPPSSPLTPPVSGDDDSDSPPDTTDPATPPSGPSTPRDGHLPGGTDPEDSAHHSEPIPRRKDTP